MNHSVVSTFFVFSFFFSFFIVQLFYVVPKPGLLSLQFIAVLLYFFFTSYSFTNATGEMCVCIYNFFPLRMYGIYNASCFFFKWVYTCRCGPLRCSGSLVIIIMFNTFNLMRAIPHSTFEQIVSHWLMFSQCVEIVLFLSWTPSRRISLYTY